MSSIRFVMKSGMTFSGNWYGPKLFEERVTTTGSWYVVWYESAMRSDPAFDADAFLLRQERSRQQKQHPRQGRHPLSDVSFEERQRQGPSLRSGVLVIAAALVAEETVVGIIELNIGEGLARLA